MLVSIKSFDQIFALNVDTAYLDNSTTIISSGLKNIIHNRVAIPQVEIGVRSSSISANNCR